VYRTPMAEQLAPTHLCIQHCNAVRKLSAGVGRQCLTRLVHVYFVTSLPMETTVPDYSSSVVVSAFYFDI
jgi:hypothetical protein